jgi:hypothetical protein
VVAESHESRGLDLVYTPSDYFGVVFAERDVARRTAQVWHAVQESTTWGEFRTAMPPTDWEELVDQREGDIPPDDTPFTPDDVGWGDDGWYLGPWPPEEEVKWFPEDLIDKYGGAVDWANPNYDQLSLPGDAAEEIAEELRARGHQVEKTFTGDLNYWLSSTYDDAGVSETSESTASSSTRLPAFLEALQAYKAAQVGFGFRYRVDKAEAEGDEDTEGDNTGSAKRRPIFMLSMEGKTKEQLADEAWAALQAYQDTVEESESED